MQCARWNDSYSLGIPSIDDQHKKLLSMMNQFCESLEQDTDPRTFLGGGIAKTAIEDVLNGMTDYAETHFTLEEKYFKEFKYDQAEEHIAKHDEFRGRVVRLKADFAKGKNDVAAEAMAYLSNWLVEHVLTMDRQYVECFHKHGL
jgi:hemerythrin